MSASNGLKKAYDVVRNALHAVSAQTDVTQIGIFETQGIVGDVSPRAPNSQSSILFGAIVVSG